jgi:nitrogen fixation-related uncharacterized protein
MTALLVLVVISAVFAALGMAALRWGADTRDWDFSR